MNPLLWTWILSLTGASIFFGAGAVFNARRLAPHGRFTLRELFAPQLLQTHTEEPERPDPSLAFRVRDAGPDIEAQLNESNARCAALEREIERRNADRALLASELDATRKRAEEHRRLASAESDALRARLNTQAQGGSDAATAALHHELAMSKESARSQTTKLEELRHENARLRQTEEELARVKRELSNLVAQARDLRAQVYASKSVPPPKKRVSSPPKISTLSGALQSIVDSETRSSSVKSAVIADELGLLVAASGASSEYGDALAALGAYLADVGTKTRDVLPLHEVRQVVVRDDRDMTLTVRPLVSDDPGLALVTLSVDPKPIVTHS